MSKKYEALHKEALELVCMCFKPYVEGIGYTAPDPTVEELKAVIDDRYYFHREAEEDWRDCPEWAQDRAETIAESQVDEMRGK